MQVLKFLSAFALLAVSSEAVVFLCDYRMITLPGINDARYTCQARVLDIGISDTLTGIAGNHMPGRGQNDVEFLHVSDPQNVATRIVHRISNYFRNLISIDWDVGGVLQISNEDFADFPELLSLRMNNNPLTTLDSDLFSNTPLLFRIDFRNNRIKHVGVGIFDDLLSLQAVFLAGNICVNDDAETRVQILILSILMNDQCPLPKDPSTCPPQKLP